MSDLVPHGRFRGNVLGFAVFGGFWMVIFQMSWSVLVVCSKLCSSCMRLRSELPSGKCPRQLFLFLTDLFSWAISNPDTGLLEAPC